MVCGATYGPMRPGRGKRLSCGPSGPRALSGHTVFTSSRYNVQEKVIVSHIHYKYTLGNLQPLYSTLSYMKVTRFSALSLIWANLLKHFRKYNF